MVKKKVQATAWEGVQAIDKQQGKISISRQRGLLGVSRSAYYYRGRREKPGDIEEKAALKRLCLQLPFYGYRKMEKELKAKGLTHTTLKRVRRLMRQMGLKALCPKKLTSGANKRHKVYPYLLRNKQIRHPNQVWATDITHVKLKGGFVYLVAVMDLYSRKVLSWKLSTTLDVHFCIEALREAMKSYGVPAIFNTDQGSQFTSYAFTKVLKEANIAISMDGRGRWRDNIYVERLWRSLKYEDIYLKSYDSPKELKAGLSQYFNFYNNKRFHESLDYGTPQQMHESFRKNGGEVA